MTNAQMKSIDAVYLPEMAFDLDAEAARLKEIMDRTGHATVFVSEGACLDAIVAEREAAGETVKRDAFGHVKIDTINVGGWFQKQFASLHQRRALARPEIRLLRPFGPGKRRRPASDPEHDRPCRRKRPQQGSRASPAMTKRQNGKLRTIEFPRIKGGKAF